MCVIKCVESTESSTGGDSLPLQDANAALQQVSSFQCGVFSPWRSQRNPWCCHHRFPSSRLLLGNYPEYFLPPSLHTLLQRISCSPPIWRFAKIPTSPPGGAGSSPLGWLPQTWNNQTVLYKLSQMLLLTPQLLKDRQHANVFVWSPPSRHLFPPVSAQALGYLYSFYTVAVLSPYPRRGQRHQFQRWISTTLQEAAKSPGATFLTLFLSVLSLEVFPGHPFRKRLPCVTRTLVNHPVTHCVK